MTYRITLELDCNQGQAILAYNALTEWAHTGDTSRLDDRWLDLAVDRMSPSVSIEHSDDDLHEAAGLLRRLGFATPTPADRIAAHQARGGRIL